MATANAITSADYNIEYSANGTTGWASWNSFIQEINPSGGDVEAVEFRAFGDDIPDILSGKTGTQKANLKVIYTEAAAEPGDILYTAQTTKIAVYLRVSPKGGQTGEQQFTSSRMFVTSGAAFPPAARADGNEVVTADVSVVFKSWTKADAT